MGKSAYFAHQSKFWEILIMVKKNLQVNCSGTLAMLLIVSLFASSIVYGEEELTAEELLAQCRDKYELAEKYWVMQNYSEAKSLYQYISQNSSDSNLALKGQTWVAGCETRLGNGSAAEQVIETLKTDYSQHENLCKEIHGLANNYWHLKKFGKAKALYLYVSQNSSDSNLAIKGQASVAHCEIKLGNNSAADQVIETLKTDYSQHENLCKEIYDIAEQYWTLKKYDEAKALYQYISQNTSDSSLAIKGRAGLVYYEIRLGNDSTADQAFEKLTNDYSQHPDLPKVAMTILAYVVRSKIRSGDDTAAEQAFETLWKEYGSDEGFVDKVLSICKIFFRANDPAMALSYIDRALEASPDHEKATLLLKAKAQCYASMGFTDQADTILDEIAQNDPTNEEFIGALTKVVDSYRSDLVDDNDANNFYTAVITDHPRTQAAMAAQAGLTFMHFENINDVQVLAAYDKLVTEYKGLPEYGHYTFIIPEEYYVAGVDAMKQGNRDVARANFTIAKTLWEKVDIKDLDANRASETLFFTGISSNYVGDPNTAIEYLLKVVSDYPSFHFISSARYHIPQYAQNLKIKDPARAQKADVLIEKYLKEYIENHPDKMPFQVCLRNLGKFYYRKAQYAQALDRFEQLIEKDYQELGRVVNMMSTCYERLGSPETADELRAIYLRSLNL
jgi:tetratricopeptide (TPR) repeat protein